MKDARYTTQRGRAAHSARPGRESLSKRLGLTGEAIKARGGHRCAYCSATSESSGAPLQLDHLTPRSQGGADTARNLVPACRPCNAARQDKRLGTWCRMIGVDSRTVRAQARRALPDLGQRRAA